MDAAAPTPPDKATLRQQVLAARRAMGSAARAAAAEKICHKIRQMPQYQQASCLAAFAPMPEEVDIWAVIQDSLERQKTVALPRVADKTQGALTFHRFESRAQLQEGYMGILEPAPEEKLISPQLFDFLLIPAVAIGKNKKRLGYGGGFYDRVLATSRVGCACAPVFSCQVVGAVPCENHDQSVDFVITE